MQKLITTGRVVFAIGIMALGILQFFARDYIIGRPPSPSWSAEIPGKIIWAYASGIFFIVAGSTIIFYKKAGLIAFAVGIIIITCSFLLRSLPQMFVSSWEGILWSINAYKSLALAGGAFIVAVSFFKNQRRNYKWVPSETFSGPN